MNNHESFQQGGDVFRHQAQHDQGTKLNYCREHDQKGDFSCDIHDETFPLFELVGANPEGINTIATGGTLFRPTVRDVRLCRRD